MLSIEEKLDIFQAKYSHLVIKQKSIDLTDCFISSEKRHIYPYSYGNLTVHNVIAYVVLGGKFVEKYARDKHGKMIRDDRGLPIVKQPFSIDMDIMSSICVYDLRNTSLHEIKQPLTVTANIQGYRRWHLKNIENTLTASCPEFNPENDSAFIFAGAKPNITSQLELNALWLSQIISHGRNLFADISERELTLMGKVFPPEVLAGNPDAICQRSYMYGKTTHNPSSVIFLQKKINLYQLGVMPQT